MKILVTGFEPFGGEEVNPSIEAVKKLPDKIAGARIVRLEVPVVCHKALAVIEEAVKKHDPDVILSVGQAGGRAELGVERVGINVDDYRSPDNEGNQPVDEPVFAGGPDAYFVNLPVKAMVQRIRKKGIPAAVSNTAGTFVCNHVTYGVRHLIETKYPGKRSGFIHIPYLPQQVTERAGMPSMSAEVSAEGLAAAIEAAVENERDLKITEGAEH